MSPRCQVASTDPAAARTASRATRLLWTSEMTAIRTRTNLAVTRSPRPALAHCGISWIGVRGATSRGHDHQPMLQQAGHIHPQVLDRAAIERGERPFRGRDLDREIAALPGHEDAAR